MFFEVLLQPCLQRLPMARQFALQVVRQSGDERGDAFLDLAGEGVGLFYDLRGDEGGGEVGGGFWLKLFVERARDEAHVADDDDHDDGARDAGALQRKARGGEFAREELFGGRSATGRGRGRGFRSAHGWEGLTVLVDLAGLALFFNLSGTAGAA